MGGHREGGECLDRVWYNSGFSRDQGDLFFFFCHFCILRSSLHTPPLLLVEVFRVETEAFSPAGGEEDEEQGERGGRKGSVT